MPGGGSRPARLIVNLNRPILRAGVGDGVCRRAMSGLAFTGDAGPRPSEDADRRFFGRRPSRDGSSGAVVLAVLLLIAVIVAVGFYIVARHRARDLEIMRVTEFSQWYTRDLADRNGELYADWTGRYGERALWRCRDSGDPDLCRVRYLARDRRDAAHLHVLSQFFIALATCVEQDFCDYDTAILTFRRDVMRFTDVYDPYVRADPQTEDTTLDSFIDDVASYGEEDIGAQSPVATEGPPPVTPGGGYAQPYSQPYAQPYSQRAVPLTPDSDVVLTTPDQNGAVATDPNAVPRARPSFFDRMWWKVFGRPHRQHHRS